MDLDALRVAGLYDRTTTAERLALLEFLVAEGCSVEEMQIADARGRLFALAGDRRIRPLVGLLTLTEAAARLEVEPVALGRAWRTFGLPDTSLDVPVLAESDVEALSTYLLVRGFIGEETALGVARVVGAALARITEAMSSAMRVGMEGVIDLGVTGDEVKTATAYAAVTELVPRIGQLLDTLFRQHLEATRVHFEDIDRDVERTAFLCGVGFADLSGFTKLSQQLTLSELSQVLTAFEETATDTIQAGGGRIVKFLGDAVMWVSAEPTDLAQIAGALTCHPKALEAGIEVRAGIAYGRLLAQDGDYFGMPVNLASRLVGVAEPGQVLAAGELVDALGPGWLAVPGVPQLLKGFEDPVTPYTVSAG